MAEIIRCRGVTKIYRQGAVDVPALRGVGLDRPTAGDIAVDGEAITQMDGARMADLRLNKIGFVFQTYSLVPVLSALENVEFILQLLGRSAAERQARAREVLREVGLEGLEDRRPSRLSGGQQQRVAVARALAPKPAIVLADEPSANRDSKNAEELIGLMAQLNAASGV